MSTREAAVPPTGTRLDYPAGSCIHQLFEQQVARTPDHVALVFQDSQLTYRELSVRANQVAHRLQQLGVGPETLVGISMQRSLEMIVGMLGILKAGGAYLPLDPAYPRERLAFMLQDARVPVILTQHSLVGTFTGESATLVALDAERDTLAALRPECPASHVRSHNLAYVIYTSGSTGKPKGVMVSHRNVVNFFAGMDQKIGPEPGVWLAVTSISFDISVLELFWTLTRGFRVILQEEPNSPEEVHPIRVAPAKPLEFSLFYFGGDEGAGADKYKLLIEGARFADQNGFTAVWSPERHFHAFGGMFPNPSVTSAALAMLTSQVQIRAGSVVLPLHDPLRVAEEWSVVDNLSHGRVGISFASGWHDKDFVFAPQNYAERKKVMFRDIATVRALWRGETIQRQHGSGGEVGVSILPRPVQPELPFWVTASGDPETFRMAGEAGANLLTHLLGQSLEELEAKIAIYRQAYSGAQPAHVTLMLHTYVGDTPQEVAERVRQPFCQYLKTSVDLMRQVAKGLGAEFAGGNLTAADLESLIDHAFDRYFESSGLFGTAESCAQLVDRLKQIGVDEVGCLIDFGIESDRVLASLENLRQLMEAANRPPSENSDYSIPAQIVRHRATHLQCTPSQARMLLMTSGGPEALASLGKLMVGGEALPLSLAENLRQLVAGDIFNMYGPTETTVWSTVHRLVQDESAIFIGSPIANTSVHVLDENREPVAPGEAGELYIGGDGVVRGYLNRPELTAERFVLPPFCAEPAARLYRTGDLVRCSPQGYLEYLGRLDQQIKILGHRIEPGEIEAALETHPGVRQAVVTATGGVDGVPSLAAYIKLHEAETATVRELRAFLQTQLPPHMIPSAFVFLAAFPLTPNGKIDRRQLPRPQAFEASVYAAPHNAVEEKLAAIWAEALGVERVGVNDNFLDSGGHSLTAVQIAFAIRREFSVDLPLQALFDFPTIGGLAVELEARLSELAAGPAPSIALAPIRGRVPQPGNGAATNARIA